MVVGGIEWPVVEANRHCGVVGGGNLGLNLSQKICGGFRQARRAEYMNLRKCILSLKYLFNLPFLYTGHTETVIQIHHDITQNFRFLA